MKGKFIAFVSTEAETDNPETELKPGVNLLGPTDELFYDTYDRFEPTNDPSSDNCYVSTVSCYFAFFVSLFFNWLHSDDRFSTSAELRCNNTF